jgi:3-isopropylmalate/(R)-2-methylmalate dehydratase small subunit
MNFIYRGKVAWKFGDFFSGDLILGDRMGFREQDPQKLKNYVLTDFDPEFPVKFRRGDLMVAGRYFGGTRDHGGMAALKALGVSCVVAESWGRPEIRKCITYGFPVLECPGISTLVNKGDELEVNLRTGELLNLTSGKALKTNPAHEIQLEILEAGGFIAYLKKKLEEDSRQIKSHQIK